MASVIKRKRTKADGSNGDKWTVRYVDQTGARRSKAFDQKKLADAFERKVEREIEDGTHVAEKASATIADVAKAYIEDLDQRLADGRVGLSRHASIVAAIDRYFIPLLGRVLARDLTVDQSADLYRRMVRAGLKPRSAKAYMQMFALVERYARKRSWMKTQPVTDAIYDLRGIAPTKVATFQEAEVAKLIAYARTRRDTGAWARRNSFVECAISLAVLCGLRLGEIIGLPASAVDFDARTIRIYQSRNSHRQTKAPKTPAGVREVPMPRQLEPALREWIADHYTENEGGLLFTTRNNTPYLSQNARLAWTNFLTAAGVPRRNFHSLRHFRASFLVQHQVPITEVAKMLGHSHFDVTLRTYAHPLADSSQRLLLIDNLPPILALTDAHVTHGL